jgi:hypothetical protein
MRKAQKIRNLSSISQASLSSSFSFSFLVLGGISSCDHPWEDVAKVAINHPWEDVAKVVIIHE